MKTALFFLVLTIAFVSCDKDKLYPSTPEIISAELIPMGDAADIKVIFTDGDGDFGLDDNETNPIYADSIVNAEGDTVPNRYAKNIFIDYEVKDNGQWVLVNTPGTAYGRFPVITPEGQNKQIRATLTYHMQPSDFALLIEDEVEAGDTIRYAVQVVDRALQESNRMATNEYIIP